MGGPVGTGIRERETDVQHPLTSRQIEKLASGGGLSVMRILRCFTN
jgi:hypothetical protein